MDAWLHQRRVTYPVFYDLDGEAGAVFSVDSIPAIFVLDADWLVRFEFSHIGEMRGSGRQLPAAVPRADQAVLAEGDVAERPNGHVALGGRLELDRQ